MRKYFLFFLILICQFSFSQKSPEKTSVHHSDKKDNCISPHSSMGTNLIKDRLGIYAQKKINSKQSSLSDGIPYSVNAFKDLFKKLNNPAYDGLRIYFAEYPAKQVGSNSSTDSGWSEVPAGQFRKPALVFVPTKANDTDINAHIDDTNNCWTLKDDQAQIISAKIASIWINNAQVDYLNNFEVEGKVQMQDSDYHETHALWYANKLIQTRKPRGDGLIDYLMCRIGTGNIDVVNMMFAGFLKNNLLGFGYQLSLIFNFHDPHNKANNNYESLYIGDLPSLFTNDPAYTDTGRPCPPPNCPIAGSLLPNQ